MLLLRVAEVGFLASLLAVLLALIALVVRFRASSGDERQQLKWLLVAAVLVPVAGISDAAWGLPVVWLVAVAALPVAVGVAIMKYGLYQIDPLINRSLVYGGLTAAVLGVYVSAVTIVGTVLQNQRIPAPLIAAGTVAVAFQPVRDRLQRAVNRMMYGERDDPYAVLSRLGQRLEGPYLPTTYFRSSSRPLRTPSKYRTWRSSCATARRSRQRPPPASSPRIRCSSR